MGAVVARFDGGWTKNYRILDRHWVGADGWAYALFLRLVSWANYEQTKKFIRGELIIIERGQLLTSVRELANSFKFDRSSVERRLQAFEKDGMIVRELRHPGTIITICNYDKYQCINDEPETQNRHRTATRPANPPANPPALIQEVKKETNKERVSIAPTGNVKEFIIHYCDEFMNTYGTNPVFAGRTIGAAKRIVKDIGLETAKKLITAFFQIRTDPWFTSKRHSLELFEKNLESIKVYADTGKYITIQHAQSRERQFFKR